MSLKTVWDYEREAVQLIVKRDVETNMRVLVLRDTAKNQVMQLCMSGEDAAIIAAGLAKLGGEHE